MNRKALLITTVILFTVHHLSAQSLSLQPGEVTGAPGSEAEVPILISGSEKAGPMQFILLYDPNILEAITDPPGSEPRGVVFGEVIENGGMLEQSILAPGELYIRFVTEDPVSRDGELLKVRFKVLGKSGETCPLSIDVPEAWEKETLHEVRVTALPATFTVGGPALPLPLPVLIAIAVVLLLMLVLLLSRKKKVPPVVEPGPPMRSSSDDSMEKLKQLKELLDAKILTQEEFDQKKKELLDKM